jgi:hypothetical protein
LRLSASIRRIRVDAHNGIVGQDREEREAIGY